MPPTAPRSSLEPRGLSAGAKAGVSVGTVLGSLLILLCLWPVIARFRNRRRRRHAGPDELPGEGPATFAAPAMVEAPAAPADRRMSTDSYVQRMDNRLASRRSTKDLTLASSDGTDASTARAPLPPAATSAPVDMPAESPSSAGPLPSPIDVEMARMVASCESRGYSGSYYNTDIPSEAFGLTSSPTWDSQISHPSLGRSPTRMSASTLLSSLFRKVTGPRGSSSSPSTVVGPTSPFPDSTIAAHAFSESPTELEPPPNELSRSSEEQASRAVDLSRIEFPAPASPPLALPGHAPPGTVNPMQVMGAMTAAEQSWLTNAELMNLTTAPSHNPVYSNDPIPPAEASITPDGAALGINTPSPSSSESTPEPGPILEDVSHSQDYTTYTSGVNHHPEPQFTAANGIPDVTIKAEPDVPITAPDYMRPVDGQVHQYTHHQRHASSENPYYTDHSTYSTPFPAPSPSGASTLNTPDTRITDTSPSPKPMTSPEIKQSSSPNPRIPLSPQSPQILVCDKCGQKFDQPHKLNHHKRYHDRPHVCERPGCGKRFGTKTHLDRHINDKHEQTRRYHCPEPTCSYSRHGGKSFPRKDNLRRHMVNIHRQNPLPDQEFEFVDVVMAGT